MLPENFAFVDVETTGLSPTYDRVIEIGIIRVERGKVVEKFESLVNPGGLLPQEITSLTSITNEQLAKAPSFWEIKGEVGQLLEGAIFAAHNVRFDYSFLRNEFKRMEVSFSPKQFCTAKLSRYLYPRYSHHSVDSLIDRFGINCDNRHRALADSEVIWEFFKKAQEEVVPEKFDRAVDLILKKPTVPMMLDQNEVDNLPQGPGVYLFYSENGTPLYIGKSKNIRERVKGHFSSDYLSGKEMKIAQQVTRVETIKTSGELGALMLESSLVKKMQPAYNRMLRYSSGVLVLREKEVKKGYKGVEIVSVDQIDLDNLDQVLGVFKNKRSVGEYLQTLVEEYQLCPQLLGIEKTLSSCFGYRLGKCFGACVGKEDPLRYNLRFSQAMSSKKIKPWPFSGPIVISEVDLSEGTSEAFLVDKWCFLGKINQYEGGDSFESREGINFDVDNYIILANYILDPDNQRKIQIFNPKTVVTT